MSEIEFYRWLITGWTILAGVIFVVLFFVTAPYGRFTRSGFGPRISQRLGWVLMETPSAVLMAAFFLLGNRHTNLPAMVFLVLWEVHYIQRALVYPFRLRGSGRQMTWLTVLLGVLFNVGNVYLNGRYLFTLAPVRDAAWLADPRFIFGLGLFAAGHMANKRADATLRGLRSTAGSGYAIPRGGLFERVSAANYLGELIEWTGWAVLTWSAGGAVFALWTAANLIPRAHSIHRWYRETFPEYPKQRKAIIPHLF